MFDPFPITMIYAFLLTLFCVEVWFTTDPYFLILFEIICIFFYNKNNCKKYLVLLKYTFIFLYKK